MKNKIIRYTLNGVILAAVAVIGITAYQIGTSPSEEKIIQEMENKESEEFAMLEDQMAKDENLEEYQSLGNEENFSDDEMEDELADNEKDEISEMNIPEENDISGEKNIDNGAMNSDGEDISVTSENIQREELEIAEDVSVESDLIDIEVPEEESQVEETSTQSLLKQLHFSDVTEIEWPTHGEILLDYNMNQTIYFPTLDQYKLNPAIAVKAEEGTPVLAAASGVVYDIIDHAQTGTTVTMELGDGYQAIYGQLKDLTMEEGEMIEQGTVIGYIDTPTKYYSVEGANLYFSMKKNGKYIDPKEYLPEYLPE